MHKMDNKANTEDQRDAHSQNPSESSVASSSNSSLRL